MVSDVDGRTDREQAEQPPRCAATAARVIGRRLAVAVEGDAVELHAMVDEAKAELLGDPFLQRFELIVDELDDVAGLDVDQMVVMASDAAS